MGISTDEKIKFMEEDLRAASLKESALLEEADRQRFRQCRLQRKIGLLRAALQPEKERAS
jgi:hypothetical protein